VSPRAAIAVAMAALLFAGCAQPAGTPAPSPEPDRAGSALPEPLPPPPLEEAPAAGTVVPEVDTRCRVDADCAVKNVGNCCGYYPACVNRDSPTFPELVARQCAEQGLAGICGYPEIRGCACVEGRCEPSDGESM
jgi:hypothetical protein